MEPSNWQTLLPTARSLLTLFYRNALGRRSRERIGVGECHMLIVNDVHLRLAGIASLEEPCPYCSQTLAAYPLIMSDDAAQTVYHITCALQLATDIIVDVDTFFHPPTPY